MKDNCGPGMTCGGWCGGNCSGSYPEPEPQPEETTPEQGDECTCRLCTGSCACCDGSRDTPEPVAFTADTDPLEQYALGWTHGWDDHEARGEDGSWWIGFEEGHIRGRERGDKEGARRARRGLFNGFAIASTVWALVGLFILACPAQTPAPIQAGVGPFQMGYIVDSARVELEQAWDTRNPRQVERGYCIEPGDVRVDTAMDHSVVAWAVHHVHPPESVEHATPYSITFHCSDSAIAAIHVHTPTTCRDGKCIVGGIDAAVCSVDEQDRMAAKRDAFSAIQCDRHAFVFYWPGKRG